jgi:hypothetical protein
MQTQPEISHFGVHCIASRGSISLAYSGLWQSESRDAPAVLTKRTRGAGGGIAVRKKLKSTYQVSEMWITKTLKMSSWILP